jgi:predicted porin
MPLLATEQVPPLTEQAKEELTNKPPESTLEQDLAREHEVKLEEDPLSQQQIKKIEQPESTAKDINYIRAYGSARIRYRTTENDAVLSDGGSRIGLKTLYQLIPEYNLIGDVEAGINLFDELEFLFNRGSQSTANQFGDSLFTRLLFAGIETPNTSFTFGKSWSTYYKVSSYTDRFDGTGASASGTFNAFTDGGSTGTGRADNAFQTRLHITALPQKWGIKPFNLNIQLQQGEPIPGLRQYQYGTTLGLSAILTTTNDYTIGLAYNHATIDKADLPVLKQNGIDGDARAMIIGTRWFSENWYIGAVVSRLLNHEATANTIYFDGWGSELYLQYQMVKDVYLVTGYNYLKPDSGQPLTGSFKTKYMVLGLRYAFDTLRRRIFLTYQFDDSRTTDNIPLSDTITLGVRWDFP